MVGVADGDHELEFDGRYGRRDTVEQHCGEYLFWKSWRIKITVVSQMNQFGLKVNIPFLTPSCAAAKQYIPSLFCPL